MSIVHLIAVVLLVMILLAAFGVIDLVWSGSIGAILLVIILILLLR